MQAENADTGGTAAQRIAMRRCGDRGCEDEEAGEHGETCRGDYGRDYEKYCDPCLMALLLSALAASEVREKALSEVNTTLTNEIAALTAALNAMTQERDEANERAEGYGRAFVEESRKREAELDALRAQVERLTEALSRVGAIAAYFERGLPAPPVVPASSTLRLPDGSRPPDPSAVTFQGGPDLWRDGEPRVTFQSKGTSQLKGTSPPSPGDDTEPA